MNRLPKPRTRRPFVYALPLLIILGAFALRIWQLDTQALSGDEAFSIINWTRTSVERLLTEIAVIDPQPPIALLSLYGWVQLVGDSVFAARMLSVLIGTIAVAACYALAAQLFGRQIGIIAAVTAAINPFLIWHAQDLRSYGTWIGLSALTLAALVRVFRRPSISHWIIYVVLAALSAYTYYLEAFLLIVHNLYALVHITAKRELLPKWVLSQLAVGLILAPWFLQPALRQSGYQPTAGSPDIAEAFHTFLFGATLSPEIHSFTIIPTIPPLITWLVITIIIGAVIYGLWRYPFKTLSLVIAASLFPMIALAVLAWTTGKGYFHPRYVAGSVIPTLVLIAAFITPIANQRLIGKTARIAAMVAIWGLSIASLVSYRTDARLAKAPDWPEITKLLDEQANADDLILQNYPDPAFTYYYTGSVEHQTLPEGENPPPEQTIAKLEAYAQHHDYIWFMPVESDAFDRERVVARWLEANMQLVSNQQVGATQILQYAKWDRIEAEQKITPIPNFDDLIMLRGYSITPYRKTLERGTTLYLELFWEPIINSNRSLKIYVHLIGPNMPSSTPLWAQDDHYPQMGRIDSMNWIPHTIFPDVYRITIPLNALAGQYWLTAGLYDPTTNQRVPFNGSNPVDSDSATILSFHLP
jgi:hypothetical protein